MRARGIRKPKAPGARPPNKLGAPPKGLDASKRGGREAGRRGLTPARSPARSRYPGERVLPATREPG